jgi:hypothetical protein
MASARNAPATPIQIKRKLHVFLTSVKPHRSSVPVANVKRARPTIIQLLMARTASKIPALNPNTFQKLENVQLAKIINIMILLRKNVFRRLAIQAYRSCRLMENVKPAATFIGSKITNAFKRHVQRDNTSNRVVSVTVVKIIHIRVGKIVSKIPAVEIRC